MSLRPDTKILKTGYTGYKMSLRPDTPDTKILKTGYTGYKMSLRPDTPDTKCP
jgi:hypothetical protein